MLNNNYIFWNFWNFPFCCCLTYEHRCGPIMNWWTDPEVAWVWGPSFGIFFGKYEECSVRVWGCIQLHSFASPYGKWLNLSVTVLSHFQNTHKKRREKKKQRSWWPPTVTFDLRISPEKFSTLSTRPATKPRFAGTLSRHLQQEENTRDTGG